MISLFEYQNKVDYPSSLEGLEAFLDEIWSNRERIPYFRDDEAETKKEAQQFIQFLHKTKELKSNKYVGVIHYNGERIHLLPKIFYSSDKAVSKEEIESIQLHILWWLSYCRKIKFPNYNTSQANQKSDFFEVLIYLFAKYTRELLGHSIYQQYEEKQEELGFIRGRIDLPNYINENLATGRWHKTHCVYNPFVLDNRFNQIIRFVAKLLIGQSGNEENKKYLREILFMLDGVSDVPATGEECRRIQFNPAFADFEVVRDYCQLFLEYTISIDHNNQLKLFAFLLPMEYLFEDFVYGFIEKEVEGIVPNAQATSTTLDEEGIFGLRPDLILDVNGKKVIADTKYKIIYEDTSDNKLGIKESDMYQVFTYAVRFGIPEVALLYPNTLNTYQKASKSFIVKDSFAENLNISIAAHQLPIIDQSVYEGEFSRNDSLEEIFEPLKERLVKRCVNLFLEMD
jgi:5-methylcytosine-specific restriction enzyme subunit McrC